MNELEMLRAIDPASNVPPDDDSADRLLRTVLADPRPARRRRASRRRLLLAAPVAASLLVVLALAPQRGGENLAAKAYAATAPGDEIVHEVSVFKWLQPSGAATQTQESWWRPADGTARSVQSPDGGQGVTTVIDATGLAHVRSPYAADPDHDVVLNPPGQDVDPVIRRFIDSVRSVTLAFRDDYAGQRLHDEGTTTIGGRSVHAYSADTREWFSEDRAYATYHRTFYLDAASALPIAQRVEMPGPNGTTLVAMTTVKTYEKLPATPANLAKLR